MGISLTFGWDAISAVIAFIALFVYVGVEWEKVKKSRFFKIVALVIFFVIFIGFSVFSVLSIYKLGPIPHIFLYALISVFSIGFIISFVYEKILPKTSNSVGGLVVLIIGIIIGLLIWLIMFDPIGILQDDGYYWIISGASSLLLAWMIGKVMEGDIRIDTGWILVGLTGGVYIYILSWMFENIGYGNEILHGVNFITGFLGGINFITGGIIIWVTIWLTLGILLLFRKNMLSSYGVSWNITGLLLLVACGLYIWVIAFIIWWIIAWIAGWLIGWILVSAFTEVYNVKDLQSQESIL